MTLSERLHVTRRFVLTLAGAWLSVAVGLVLNVKALTLAGLFLGILVAIGTHAPRRAQLKAVVAARQRMPQEEQMVDVRVDLENRGRRTQLTEWKVELPGVARAEAGPTAGVFALPPQEDVSWDFKVAVQLFGLRSLGPVRVRMGDPFGFAFLESTVGKPDDLRVAPRREPLTDGVLRTRQIRVPLGAYEVTQPGDGFEFFGLRGYVTGDRPRDVNWKASARGTTLIVNQHQRENNAEIVLLVDARADTNVGKETLTPFAQSCRAALAIAEAHLHRRDNVRFVVVGSGLQEDRHTGPQRGLQGIMDLLVGLRPEGALPLGDAVTRLLPSLRPKTPIIVLSPFVGDQTIEGALSTLRAANFPIVAYVPRPEWGPQRSPEAVQWSILQQLNLARLRRMGIPTVTPEPDELLAEAVTALEVMARNATFVRA